MENKDISQIALDRIKESGIKPVSKQVFNLKRVLFWSLVGFSILVGAMSFSVTLSILLNNDWYLFDKFGFNFILKTLPYFWVFCLLLFTILGEVYYRKTFLGYRHRIVTIVGVYILLTLVLGIVLYILGMGEKFEKTLAKNVPVYHGMMFDKEEFWSHPESGLLSGRIIGVNGSQIKIIDLNNVVWLIDTENAFIGGRVIVNIGEEIKIIGNNDTDDIFHAEQIRPWNGGRPNKDNARGFMMR